MIYPNTLGVVFLGTPHRGSDKAGIATVKAAVARLSLRPSRNKLLSTLKQDSDILEAQRQDFTRISTKMDLVCVYEELRTDGFEVSTFASIDEDLSIYPRQHQFIRACMVSNPFLSPSHI